MKTVLCFGDSITWGYDPATRERMSLDERWPGVLRRAMRDQVRVIEEGLCGRTAVWDDPYVDGRNGKAMLAPLLESHAPVDLLVIMLGTNDLQRHFGKGAAEVALGLAALADLARRSGCGPGGTAPEILLIAPPAFGRLAPMERLSFAGKERAAAALADAVRAVAETRCYRFLDASAVVTASAADGIHLDIEGHARLAVAVQAEIETLFG